MLDFDAGKLFIIGIVALLVIGPKELPRVLRQLGQWTGKMRRMASEFQGQFMDAMREADFESLKKEVSDVAAAADVGTHFDPIGDVHREMTAALESKPQTPLASPAEPLPALTPAADAPLPLAAAGVPTPEPRFASGESIAADVDAQPYATVRDGSGMHSVLSERPADTAAKAEIAVPPAANDPVRPSVLGASRADALAAAARRRTARTQAVAANLRRRPAVVAPPSDTSASTPKTEA